MYAGWVGPAIAVLVLAGCGQQMTPRAAGSPTPVSSDQETPRDPRRCSDAIPFEPTYLPGGFDDELRPGPAPNGRPPDEANQVIWHLAGSGGRAIEVRRPGTLFVELAQGDDAPTIQVLGQETASFGPIHPGGDEYIAFITYPADADALDRCAWFSLNEINVSLAELKKVAEGLRESD